MAEIIKINSLTEIATISDDDVLPIVDISEMETKKVKFSDLVPAGVLTTTDVIDNLTSTETTKPLSANQGKVLDTRLTTAEGEIDTAQTDIDNLQTGWNVAGETWTYASVDDPTGVITISGDVTTKYSLGMRIKFTNGSNVIYGIITAISFSSPNTTITFLHEINPSTSQALHLMTNSAITDNYYSTMKVPFGFSINPSHWSILFTDTTNRNQASPTVNQWYNLGPISKIFPIGVWTINYSVAFTTVIANGGSSANIYIGLATTNLSPISSTIVKMTSVANTFLSNTAQKSGLLFEFTDKTTLYVNEKTELNANSINIDNGQSALVINAVCAYL